MLNHLLFGFERGLLALSKPWLNSRSRRIISDLPKLPPVSNSLLLTGTSDKPPILVIGESTAAGVGASVAEYTFSAQLHALLNKEYSISNYGKNGLKANQLTWLLESERGKENHYPIVIILIGANDCFQFTAPGDFASAISSFSLNLKNNYQTKQIILQTIPPVQEFPAIPAIGRLLLGFHRYLLNNELRKLQKQSLHFEMINVTKKYDEAFFASDGIHPSDEGYRVMAEITYGFIKKSRFIETAFS